MTRIFAFVLFLMVTVLGLAFAVLNADSVPLRYYFGASEVPLALLVVLAVVLGAVLGVLASLGVVLKQKREIAKLRKAVRLTEKEVLNLRAIPLKDVH